MSNRYSFAPADVQKRVQKVRGKFHVGLTKGRVKIDVLFVTPQEEDDGAPIKQWGTPQIAKTRIVGQRDRGAGRGDAEIVIDAREWGTLTIPEQDAVIDRQLAFLKVKTDEDGNNCLDGNNRPKLTMQRPTRIFAWFDEVAKRHGAHSQEQIQARELISTTAGQLYFPGLEPPKAKAGKADAGNVVKMPAQQAQEKAAAK